MIDLHDLPPVLRLTLVLSPFFLAVPGPAMIAFMTLGRDYGIASAAIMSSPFLERMKLSWGQGNFKQRYLFMSILCGLTTFPGMAIRKGKLDPEELEKIPYALKRRLAVASWLTIVGCVWMIVVYGYLKISQIIVR